MLVSFFEKTSLVMQSVIAMAVDLSSEAAVAAAVASVVKG
jgi:hypothetical protein